MWSLGDKACVAYVCRAEKFPACTDAMHHLTEVTAIEYTRQEKLEGLRFFEEEKFHKEPQISNYYWIHCFVTIVGISCFDCLRTKASLVSFASVSMNNEGSTEPPALPSMMVKWTAKGEGERLKKEKQKKQRRMV